MINFFLEIYYYNLELKLVVEIDFFFLMDTKKMQMIKFCPKATA